MRRGRRWWFVSGAALLLVGIAVLVVARPAADASFCDQMLRDPDSVGQDPYDRYDSLADVAPDQIADDLRWFADAQRFSPYEVAEGDEVPAAFDGMTAGEYERRMVVVSEHISEFLTDNCDDYSPGR